MITIKDFMETVNYRITEGSDYLWKCFGPNTYCLDSWDGDVDGHSISIVFDTRTQEVYKVEAFDYVNERAYRLINKDFVSAYNDECKERLTDGDEAWQRDDGTPVKFIDLETEEDFLQKASAIVAGEDYDTRVSIPVEFTDEELLEYMKLAHERDITFNQLVEEALKQAIEECQRDPEGFKQRAERYLARK